VRSIGTTWDNGSTPWSPILEINLPALPEPPDSNCGQQVSGSSADASADVPLAVLNLSLRERRSRSIGVNWNVPVGGGAVS
jgi:hypothetical protein